jgi:hypothetical protein
MAKPSFILPVGFPVKEDVVSGLSVSQGNTLSMTQRPLEFIRNSDAWRIDRENIIRRVPFNLLKGSETFDTPYWTYSNNVTVQPNAAAAPDGTTTASLVENQTANTDVAIKQSLPTTMFISEVGGPFNYSIYAKAFDSQPTFLLLRIYAVSSANTRAALLVFNLNSGSVVGLTQSTTTFLSAQAATPINLGGGWYRVGIIGSIPEGQVSTNIQCEFEFTDDSSFTTIGDTLYNSTAGIAKGYVWGAQLCEKLGTLTQSNTPYTPTVDRVDVARIDYSTANDCPSILIEPGRTNLLKCSQSFRLSEWTTFGVSVLTTPQVFGPDGIAGNYRIEGTLNNYSIKQDVTITNGNTYALSVYIKKETDPNWNPADLRVSFGELGTNITMSVDMSLATPTVQITASSSTYYPAANRFVRIYNTGYDDWYRAVLVFKVQNLASTNQPVQIQNTTPNKFIIYGFQFEEGEYETSYIKTGLTTYTRGAETLREESNIYDDINTEEGVIFVEADVRTFDSVGIALLAELSSNSSNYFGIYHSASNINIDILNNNNTEITVNYPASLGRNRIAIGYSNSYTVIYVNGQKVVSSNEVNVPFVNKLYIAKGISVQGIRRIQSFAIYKELLRNEELQRMTLV